MPSTKLINLKKYITSGIATILACTCFMSSAQAVVISNPFFEADLGDKWFELDSMESTSYLQSLIKMHNSDTLVSINVVPVAKFTPRQMANKAMKDLRKNNFKVSKLVDKDGIAAFNFSGTFPGSIYFYSDGKRSSVVTIKYDALSGIELVNSFTKKDPIIPKIFDLGPFEEYVAPEDEDEYPE